MSTLEERLRSELAREGRAANVGTAPSISVLAKVADRRRQRNRVAGTAVAVTMVAGLFIAALVAAQPVQSSDVIVSGAEASNGVGTDVTAGDPVASDAVPGGAAVPAEVISEQTPTQGDVVAEAREGQEQPTAAAEPVTEAAASEVVATALQAAAASADVEVRASAVDFAGGSGVFVETTVNGFGGLVTRFGAAGAEVLGIASSNGLDWVEVDLTGVPDGAAPVALDSFEGTFVAQFDGIVAGDRSTWVATSDDLVNWQVADPLVGEFVVAQHLLVGPGGVVLLGDDVEPDVWAGPIGGPYVAQAQLPTRRIGPAGVIDGKFVVLGTDADSGEEVLFTSADGVSWTSEPSEGATIPTGLGTSSQTFLGADGEVIAVNDVLGLDGAARFAVVNVDAEVALVLVDTEDGLTWVTIRR